MKKSIYFFLLFVILSIFFTCNNEDIVKATSVVNGEVAVPDKTYWPYIKIGIFSGGSGGNYTYLLSSSGGKSIFNNRLIYSNVNDLTTIPITPVIDTSYSIKSSGDTRRTYSFTLPSAFPNDNEIYYFAAWYDSNLNGTLDLIDSNVVPENGEFNRTATKAIVDAQGNPTIMSVNGFIQSTDSWHSGWFIYSGWDSENPNITDYVDTTTNFGFNFVITANSGW